MKKTNLKKLTLAGLFCSIAIVGSMFSFVVLGSRCSPVQHMVNILCSISIGTKYSVSSAFGAALLRNLLGLGSLMAFPGSIFGAFLSGVIYGRTKSVLLAIVGEVFGTGVIGGLFAYPIAVFVMGQNAKEIAFYTYIVPFLVSTIGGAIFSTVIICSLKDSKLINTMKESLQN